MMTRRSTYRAAICFLALIGLGALLICVSAASAEEPPVLKLGARVRASVTEPSPGAARTKRLTGTLVGLDETAITLATSRTGFPVVLPRQNLSMLELSLRRSQRWKGALIGAGVGAVTGVLIGLASGDDWLFSAEMKASALGLLLAPVGTLLGAALAPGERWMRLHSEQIHLGLDNSRRRRSALSLSVSF